MLSRTVFVWLPLLVLLVEGDLDSNHAAVQPISTDKDMTSEEAPTESMKSVSPDQPDESQLHHGRLPDTSSSSSETINAHASNQVTALEPALATANSVEEDDEDESADSEEGGKKSLRSRSAKPRSPAHVQQSSARIAPSPARLSQPIIPQPKVVLRSRTSKRRSRTNRRQI